MADSIVLNFKAFNVHGVHGHLRIYAGHQNVADFRSSVGQNSLRAFRVFTGAEREGEEGGGDGWVRESGGGKERAR